MKVKNHQKLVHNFDLIRELMKDLKRQMKILADELRQAEDNIAEQDMDAFAS